VSPGDVTYAPDTLHPVEGAVLAAGQQGDLLVFLKVGSPGWWACDGVAIDYLYAGRAFGPLAGNQLVLRADQPSDCLTSEPDLP